MEERDVQALKEAPAFRGLPQDAFADVARAARKVTLRKGQPLFRQGASADAVFVLLSGRAKVLETSTEGQSVLLRLSSRGEMLAVVSALGQSKYPVTVEAMEPLAAAKWSAKAMWALLDAHPRIALNVLPSVLERLRAVQDQYRELATERVERRLARAVLRLVRQAGRRTEEGVRIDTQVTRQELAEMAGTTLFTASRVLSQWAEDGVLLTRRRLLLVRNPHALVVIAEDLPEP